LSRGPTSRVGLSAWGRPPGSAFLLGADLSGRPLPPARDASHVVSPSGGGQTEVAQRVYRFTLEPRCTRLPAGGLVKNTRPLEKPKTFATLSPASCSDLVAPATLAPSTSGTVTMSGPAETTSVTVLPRLADVPGAGVVEMTLPWATVSLKAFCRAG